MGGEPPSYAGRNDFALFDGRWFVSFPPFPAVVLTPFVAIAGGADATRDGLVFLMLAGVGPAILFLALERLSKRGGSGRAAWENVALALLFAFGTLYWSTAIQGTVWFSAHVVGVALTALYIYASIDAKYPVVAGVALGLAFRDAAVARVRFPALRHRGVPSRHEG